MKRFSLRYILLTSRFDQLWFPLATWGLFIIIGILRGPEYILDSTRAYLGAVVPLVSGIMAAYAIIEDPALELRFSTPISAAQTMVERLGLTFLIQTFFALAYQVFAMSMKADFSSIFSNWWELQLAWFVPTLSLTCLGCIISLAAKQSSAGAVLTGMVWIVQLVARGWFAHNDIGQYFLVFMSPFMLDHPSLRFNQITLSVLSILFLSATLGLLRRQERYI